MSEVLSCAVLCSAMLRDALDTAFARDSPENGCLMGKYEYNTSH